MPRPRKNRIAEYAARLAEELAFQLSRELARNVQVLEAAQRRQLSVLEDDLRTLRKTIVKLERRRSTKKRSNVGRWVPGGPGRPPKDAEKRVLAYVEKKGAPAAKADGAASTRIQRPKKKQRVRGRSS
ncbi:MAG: hypothetical protein HYV07_17305 [Deltaproteobacteria bacterium]|nr:hypothetical protein [Deltaproteobacteria bacterium]